MTALPPALAQALPHPLPTAMPQRLALLALRRMGGHGLYDARAAHAFVTLFGASFRRPLVLMRNLIAELSATATGPIAIAPCCCGRATAAEHALLSALARVEANPRGAAMLLADLVGTRSADGVLASAHILATAFRDAGRPF